MGVVTRQTLKNSTVMLVGVVIGAVSTLFIYPLNDETFAIVGKIQFIISGAALLVPFANMGIANLTVRFFPEFAEGKNNRRGFLGMLYLGLTATLITFLVLSYVFRSHGMILIEKLMPNAQHFQTNAREVLALTIATVYLGVTQNYLTNFQRVVVPSVLNVLFQKITIPCLVLLCYFSIFHDGHLKWLFIASKFAVLGAMLYYTFRLGALNFRIDWSFLTRERIRSMAGYALFGVLGSLGGTIAFRIDTVMIAGMLDFKKTGIYVIALFIANIMVIPNKSVGPLIGAQIAEQSHVGNISKIDDLYRRSAQSLLILGMLFFLLVWWNLEAIFSFTPNPEDLMMGRMVVFYLGMAKLFDMVTGLNNQVINFSKYYRWNLLFIMVFGTTTVLANLYFIPRLGIVGAAVATLIALTLFNVLKQLFIWWKFRIQPFSLDTLKVISLGLITSLVTHLIPSTGIPILEIGINSTLIVLLFGFPIYILNLSPEITKLVDQVLNFLHIRRDKEL